MSEQDPLIDCSTHGKARATFICSHLADNPKQRWFCNYPAEDDPWPDAWCAQCESAFREFGEWNEKNEGKSEIRLFCQYCYEDFKGESVAPLMQAQRETWEPFLQSALDELRAKQDLLTERYRLSEHERWDWNQGTGEIVFSNAGVSAVTARFQFAGSISTATDTWLWSWANFQFEPQRTADLLRVRAFGETRDFANLTVPKWPADEVDGWAMTAVAAKVLDARGAYRTPDENGFIYLLLMDVRES